MLISIQCIGQRFIDVYQNNILTGSTFSSDIDSINVTGSDPSLRRINLWRAGNITSSYVINTIDSIKVFHDDEEPLAYMGILGFNQELYIKPIDILSSTTSDFYINFVHGLTRKDGTLLYYGVENALDMLTQYDFTTPLSSVNLITFTDGLDQGSLMMTTDFQNDPEYLSYLSNRICSTYVRGIPLTAYCLGLKGNDVTNYAQFQANLCQLATSEDKAIEVSSMSAVQNHLKEIADQIINISNRQTISLKIPGQSNETRVCFTFDDETPTSSSMYIAGTFNLADRSLRNVTYYGIRTTSGNTIEGEQDGIFVTYTFTGLQRTDGNGLIPTNNIHQYNQAKDSSTWQINSEFTPDNTQTTIAKYGEVIMLVLDCSSSLGSQFSNMQNYVKDFISHLANNAMRFTIYPPTNVFATFDSDEFAVDVSWDAVKHAEYYTVYRGNNSSSNLTKIADNIINTNWRDDSPLKGNNYYYIYASGHGITSYNGSISNVVNCEIEMTAPTNVVATFNPDEIVVNLSWDAVKHAEYYTIYRSNNPSSNFTKIADNITVANWHDKWPMQGINYYCVYASGHGFTSEMGCTSNEVNCTIELAAPTDVTATLDTEELTVSISWDAVDRAETYNVYRSKDLSSEFHLLKNSVTSTNWKDYFPLKGANYYVIRSVFHGFNSEASLPSNVVYVYEHGSYNDPYKVSEAISKGSCEDVFVKGYIVGYVEGQVFTEGAHFGATGDNVSTTNILLADSPSETVVTNCIPIQLPKGDIRDNLNLSQNPSNLGKEVLLYGDITKYFGVPGLKNTSFAEIDGTAFGSKP